MSQDNQDMLEQMERILAEKEAVFSKRQKQLESYHQELKKFEEELNLKISFLEEERIRLDQEKKEVEKRWSELKEYEETVKRNSVFAEKLKLQEQDLQQLEQNLQREADEFEDRKKRLGIQTEVVRPIEEPAKEKNEAVTKDTEQVEKKGSEAMQEPICEVDDTSTTESEEKVPELLLRMEAAAQKVFPSGSVEDLTRDMLCVSVGDKEVRIFLKEPMNEAQIFTVRMGGGTDRELQQKINRTNQIQQDWVFSCRENHLTCTMPFTSQTDPDVIMEKCAECINNYFM